MKRLFWDFSGLRFIYYKVFHPEGRPSTIIFWITGIYVALVGLASQRYENRIDIIENRANAIFSQLSTSVGLKAVDRITYVQNMPCPIKQEILKPITVIQSLYKEDKYTLS